MGSIEVSSRILGFDIKRLQPQLRFKSNGTKRRDNAKCHSFRMGQRFNASAIDKIIETVKFMIL